MLPYGIRVTEPSKELLKTTIIVMGVAGSGKSTVANMLAEWLGWPMAEGTWPGCPAARMIPATSLCSRQTVVRRSRW